MERKIDLSETELCSMCTKWFKLQYPNEILIKITNEGKRSPIIARKLGIVAGIPDYFLARKIGMFGGLFIEMKTRKGKLTNSQIEMKTKLIHNGYMSAICRSFEEFQTVVKAYIDSGFFIADGSDC